MVIMITKETELQKYIADVEIGDITKKKILNQLYCEDVKEDADFNDYYNKNLKNSKLEQMLVDCGKNLVLNSESDWSPFDEQQVSDFVLQHVEPGKVVAYEVRISDQDEPNIIIINGKDQNNLLYAVQGLYGSKKYTVRTITPQAGAKPMATDLPVPKKTDVLIGIAINKVNVLPIEWKKVEHVNQGLELP